AFTLFFTLYCAQWIWINVVHANEQFQFNQYLWYINFPIYISTWVLSIFLAGGYDKQAKLFNVFGGMVAGTLVVGAIYGFFPNVLRSSRGIIVFGWLFGTLA